METACVVQLVGQCVVVRISGRNPGRPRGRPRPCSRAHVLVSVVILEVGGGVRARGHRSPHRVRGYRIRGLVGVLLIRIFNMDPQVPAFICRYGEIGSAGLICYHGPMEIVANHGVGSLGDVPRPFGGAADDAVRVGQGGVYRVGNLGLQSLQGQLTGVSRVSDDHREGDVGPLGGKGGIWPGPHLGGAHRYLVVVVDGSEFARVYEIVQRHQCQPSQGFRLRPRSVAFSKSGDAMKVSTPVCCRSRSRRRRPPLRSTRCAEPSGSFESKSRTASVPFSA